MRSGGLEEQGQLNNAENASNNPVRLRVLMAILPIPVPPVSLPCSLACPFRFPPSPRQDCPLERPYLAKL